MDIDERESDLYVNIGTVKSCMFIRISDFLLRRLQQKPLLYYAVEESLACARIGCYGIGILAFSQLLNLLNKRTPDGRHLVAHEFLQRRPSKAHFDAVVDELKTAASELSERELAKAEDIREYKRNIFRDWKDFVQQLHGLDELPLDDHCWRVTADSS